MSKLYPKVKAMGLFTSNGRFLGTANRDSVSGEDYLRLIGGHVEFGERSDETLRREITEETGADIEQLRLLDIVESIFVYEGAPGHEVIFIYHAKFTDPSFYERDSITVSDSHHQSTAIWTPAADLIAGKVRLYPVADYARFLKQVTEQEARP